MTQVATFNTRMATADDLTSLFAKNLNLSPTAPPTPPQDPQMMYISLHYNRFAHIAAQQQQQPHNRQDERLQRPSSEPPPPTELHDLELLFRSLDVDPSAPPNPHLELFRHAADIQKLSHLRLLTLCPDINSRDNPTLDWSTTTVEQEEMLTQRRLELQQQQFQPLSSVREAVIMGLGGFETETTRESSPMSMQSGDGRWIPQAHHYMEPYMQSGYEELDTREYDASAPSRDGYRTATDPVYKSTCGLLDWERQPWMGNQYGSFVGAWRADDDML